MFVRNSFRLVSGLAVCVTLFFACSSANSQETPPIKPSDPAALAVVKSYLDTFGDDVYHCKWEYDAKRELKSTFESGKDTMHVEGEWSFSAKLGSSYVLRYEGVEYNVREIAESKVLAFWPEVTREGQKFRMHLAPFYTHASPRDLSDVRTMLYPCELRLKLLEDKWGNPTVFGLKSSDSEKTIISISPLIKAFDIQMTLQTKDGIQAVKETWEVTKADPRMYEIYHGAEYEKVYSNVRVNNVWLPSEVNFKRTQDDPVGENAVLMTAQWKVVGQYTVDKDTSMFKNIDPPDGTMFYDESTNTTKRLGNWDRPDKRVN